MVSLITITDDIDTDTPSYSLGSIATEVTTFKIRVWNNRGNSLDGITDSNVASLSIQFSPEFNNNLIVRNNCFSARCTYSAKLDAVYSESFSSLPLSNANYDTIPSNKYNEYEIKLDMTGLTTVQRARIKDQLATVFFTVNQS